MSYLSDISHLLHYVVACAREKNPLNCFDKAALIISADIDVGNKNVANINNGKYDKYIHDILTEIQIGTTEEKCVPFIIKLFNNYEIPATFGIRGQLTEVDSDLIDLLLGSPIKHDIGSHGYYHRAFTNLSLNEANAELSLISKGMLKYGITPQSFIFPRNEVAHLSLLEKWGYTCYRGKGNWFTDGLFIKRSNNLFDIHPGIYLGKCHNSRYLNKFINLAIKYKLPFHIWFHPRELGECETDINKKIISFFQPFLKIVKEKERNGELTIETMSSITKKIQASQDR